MSKIIISFSTDIQYLKGVGPKLGSLLNKRGIRTVGDLLEYFPRAYEDRRAARNIASLKGEDIVSLKAHVVKAASFQMGASKRRIYDVLVKDSSGQIHCKFFRVPYKGYFERFTPFKEVRVIGKVTNYRGNLEFHHPDIRDIESDAELSDDLIPIYTEIENVTSTKILNLVRSVLEQILESAWGPEKFPASMLGQFALIARKEAILSLHKPDPAQASLYNQLQSQAHRRVIFEEFFWLELYLATKRAGLQKETSIAFTERRDLVESLLKSLPFPLTNAQKRTFSEIQKDLQQPHPMHRLVQGDVGSGKTMVAFLAACFAADNHLQSCLMAPTEILAEQHFKNAERMLSPLGICVGLLTGKTKVSERKLLLGKLASGEIHFLIGTHALIEDWVQFKNLSLIIIDEQHRFGVEQRGSLKEKGMSPHFLVMTATPIPRTLAMTVYGDLEVSIIDEMPPGRSPIQTRVIFESKRPQALTFMREQIQKGRQAYFVYPLVEESEKIDLKNAVDEFNTLVKQFPDVKMGLIHGRMKSAEKEKVMDQFRSNEIQVLVSTTVIEVGVDVPNANIMIIEHSERFGLSQLHQLRGRVGRGVHKSFCIMIMGYAVSEEARARTQFMEQNSDGFKIAEFDLQMRGPGEFLGTRQSGLPGFRMANLVRDILILQEARDAAFSILKSDPGLQLPQHQALRSELMRAHGPAFLASIA